MNTHREKIYQREKSTIVFAIKFLDERNGEYIYNTVKLEKNDEYIYNYEVRKKCWHNKHQ